MRAYVFGAGVSAAAGYPQAQQLLTALDVHLRNSSLVEHNHWEGLVNWIKTQEHLLPTIEVGEQGYLKGDIERLFTFCDLLYRGIRFKSDLLKTRMFDGDEPYPQRLDTFTGFRDKYRPLEQLLELLYNGFKDYFKVMHWRDANRPAHWDYILKWCHSILSAGDVIITLNYDGLVDRCLLWTTQKSGPSIYWSLADGYGARTKLGMERLLVPLPNRGSNIKLFKLHGSTGWAEHPDYNSIFITPQFLQGLEIAGEWDHSRPEFEQVPQMIYPSYIKPFLSAHMRSIWTQAAQALSRAEEVIVAGYSFPEADAPVETLVLASLANNRDCLISVIDKAKETRLREILPERQIDHEPGLTFEAWVERQVS